jgi:gas vesicle protein
LVPFWCAGGAIAGILLAPALVKKQRKKVVDVADKVIDKFPMNLPKQKNAVWMFGESQISVENQIQKINEVMKQNKLAEAKKKEEESIGYEI